MKTYHILTLLVVFLFTGCLKEEKMSIETLIKVNMPEGFESMNPEGIDVKLYSTTSGLTYTSKCDASGIATFNVEYGFYEAVAQHRERGENTIDIFNGRMDYGCSQLSSNTLRWKRRMKISWSSFISLPMIPSFNGNM